MQPQRDLFAGYLVIAAVLVAVYAIGAVRYLDLKLLDEEFKLLRLLRVPPAAPEVVLIGIDEETLRHFTEPFALWHRHFADLLQALAQSKPAAVGLDVVLPDRSYESIAPGYDRELVRALVVGRSAYPLVVGLTTNADGKVRPIHAPLAAAIGADGIGLTLFPVDADNVVRRFDERLAEGGAQVPTLAGQLTRKMGYEPGYGVIDYSVGAEFNYVPMHAFLARLQAGDEGLRSEVAGKIVLIGPVLRFEDHKPQPVNLARWEQQPLEAPGLLLHAQSLRSILGHGLIRTLSPAWPIVLALGFASIWFVPAGLMRTPALVLFSAAVLVAAAVLLLERRIYLEIALPLVAVVVTALARFGLQATRAFLQRRRLRDALSGYVSPEIAQEVVAGRIAAGFEGRRYRLCVMFVDMREFTPRSERMAPEELVRLINRCFEEFVAAVHEAGGTVSQFLGDGILAYFGAPNPLDNPADAAMTAVGGMFRRLEQLNARLESEAIVPIRIGVGLNVGEAVVGNVGARSRYGYAAVGDVVNVAARLEGLTKELGYPVICSRAVAKAATRRAELVALGEQAIKGHSAVEVFGWNPLPPKD